MWGGQSEIRNPQSAVHLLRYSSYDRMQAVVIVPDQPGEFFSGFYQIGHIPVVRFERIAYGGYDELVGGRL